MPLVAATTSVFTATELASLQSDLDAYLALYAPLFQRSEQVASARRYLQGLLCDEPRKSVERMVLKLWGADGNLVRSLQQFMGESPWSDSPLLARHWQEVGQTLGEEEGVLIVDGSDFRKQGQESVGVARQWCGELGKKANCQAGVFVAYAGSQAATLVHRALYLPKPWAEEPDWAGRRQRCRVPEAVSFQTKPQLALNLLRALVASGSLPARWVTCDEAYGQDPAFLDGVAELGLGYCAEVPHSTRVWTERPATAVPPAPAHGRPPTRVRLATGAPRSQEVRAVAAQQPESAWQRLTLLQGSHGPLQAEFCVLRVFASRQKLPGPAVWLLLRRHPRTHKLKTYLCDAPAEMARPDLAHLAGCRWPIETCFQEGKQNLGLGDYEGRSWAGWHRHMTLCMLAHFFLVRQYRGLKKSPGPDRTPAW